MMPVSKDASGRRFVQLEVEVPGTGVPAFDGVVERVGQAKLREVLVRLEQPAPGAGLFAAYTWDDRVMVSVSLYLYGRHAADVAARDEPLWRAWVRHTFEAREQQASAP